jgi:hypothetical protein
MPSSNASSMASSISICFVPGGGLMRGAAQPVEGPPHVHRLERANDIAQQSAVEAVLDNDCAADRDALMVGRSL